MNPFDPNTPLPSDHAAEKAVLSIALTDEHAAAICDASLTADAFHNPDHSKLWELIKDRRAEGKPNDAVGLLPGCLHAGLNPAILAEITTGDAGDPRHFHAHLRRVLDKYALRKIFRAAYDTLRASVEVDADPEQVIGLATSGLAAAEARGQEKIGMTLTELWGGLVERLDGIEPDESRIPTGIHKLDALTRGGPRRGQMALIGALRHVGKTAFARQIALNIGDRGENVLAFFAESSDNEEAANTMAVMAGIDCAEFTGTKSGFKPEAREQIERIMRGKIPKVRIDTEPNLTVDMIEARCRLLKATKGLDVVFVDYLQFLTSSPKNKGQLREQMVSEDARRLKVLARQLNIALFVLIQLSDEVSPEDEPEMRHIRESRGPVNHADIVLLMSAPDGVAHNPTDPTATQRRLLWNRKWRGVGAFQQAVGLTFKGSTQQFT